MAQDFEFSFFKIFPGDLKYNPFKQNIVCGVITTTIWGRDAVSASF